MTQAASTLLASLPRLGDKPAFVLEGQALSYAALDERSSRFARALRDLGIERGDRVALFGGTTLPGLLALVGCHKAGAIFVPINPRYRAEELSHVLADSGAKLLLCSDDEDSRSVLAALGERPANLERVLSLETDVDALVEKTAEGLSEPLPEGEDLALLIYTSGTTGRSKGVELPYRAIVGNIGALTGAWRFSEDDRLVLTLPLFHVHGLCIGVYGTLLHGMTALLAPRFEPGFVVDAFAHEGATVFMGVPTMYAKLLERLEQRPEDAAALSKARLFTAGSAALPADDLAAFERLTGHRILERYGMSETLLTLSNPYDGERRPGSVGLPVFGSELKVVDDEGKDVPDGTDGELVVRGVSLMRGYWNNPEATAKAFRDGWFLTGDVARRSADGYFTIVGRKSTDVLKSGGFKISAREIEDALRSHPSVAELAVVGVPDRTWGQRIVVAVVQKGQSALDEAALLAELQAHAAECLADYKKPRDVLVVEEMPRNAMGKVQKHRLVERYLAR